MEGYNNTMKTSLTMLNSKIEIMIRFLKEMPNFSSEIKSSHAFQQLLRQIRSVCMQLEVPPVEGNEANTNNNNNNNSNIAAEELIDVS